MSLLECDNDYVTELHAYDFIIKGFVIKKGGALFVPDPVYRSQAKAECWNDRGLNIIHAGPDICPLCYPSQSTDYSMPF